MINLTKADYDYLLTTGELWDQYPEATGDYQRDCEVDLNKLYTLLGKAEREKQAEIYNEYFDKAIKLKGFTDKQVSAINFKAWQDGHSSGYQEVVGCAMELCEFAKDLLKG